MDNRIFGPRFYTRRGPDQKGLSCPSVVAGIRKWTGTTLHERRVSITYQYVFLKTKKATYVFYKIIPVTQT